MLSNLLRLTFFVVISVIALSFAHAQEAVESPTPIEEGTPKPKKQASPEKPTKSLEETMRPEEFKAAGLDKLSEDEMQHLDAYLQGYRQSAQKKASEQAKAQAQEEIKKANEKVQQAEKATEEVKRDAAASRSKLDTLVSRVDGTIDGVKGHAVIRLEDGSVWKQVNPDERYPATIKDHPNTVVMHTTFGYKMRIEGMPEFYVDPVVRP
jgi:predicted ribosome quality control (RQC) complex YloA/Tae2 family protein